MTLITGQASIFCLGVWANVGNCEHLMKACSSLAGADVSVKSAAVTV